MLRAYTFALESEPAFNESRGGLRRHSRSQRRERSSAKPYSKQGAGTTSTECRTLPRQGNVHNFSNVVLLASMETHLHILLKPVKDPPKPSSYPPVSLLDTIGKLLESILLTKILSEVSGERFYEICILGSNSASNTSPSQRCSSST